MRYYNCDIDPGNRCHWCGEPVGEKRGFRTGTHVYCANGRKCQMAHARARAKYTARVTASAPAEPGQVESPAAGGNGSRPTRIPTSSRTIAGSRLTGGNARKGRK
jgi:hypothetical protein